jgi:hypothetical protein
MAALTFSWTRYLKVVGVGLLYFLLKTANAGPAIIVETIDLEYGFEENLKLDEIRPAIANVMYQVKLIGFREHGSTNPTIRPKKLADGSSANIDDDRPLKVEVRCDSIEQVSDLSVPGNCQACPVGEGIQIKLINYLGLDNPDQDTVVIRLTTIWQDSDKHKQWQRSRKDAAAALREGLPGPTTNHRQSTDFQVGSSCGACNIL